MSNGVHAYHGVTMGRAARLASKLGAAITLQRLDALLGGPARPPAIAPRDVMRSADDIGDRKEGDEGSHQSRRPTRSEPTGRRAIMDANMERETTMKTTGAMKARGVRRISQRNKLARTIDDLGVYNAEDATQRSLMVQVTLKWRTEEEIENFGTFEIDHEAHLIADNDLGTIQDVISQYLVQHPEIGIEYLNIREEKGQYIFEAAPTIQTFASFEEIRG